VDRDGCHTGFEEVLLSIGRFSAKGAEFESRIHGFIATVAPTVRDGVQGLATLITCQYGDALFHPQKRDKKQAEIMIDALVIGCFQATDRTNPRVFIEHLGFGLNASDQKHIDIT